MNSSPQSTHLSTLSLYSYTVGLLYLVPCGRQIQQDTDTKATVNQTVTASFRGVFVVTTMKDLPPVVLLVRCIHARYPATLEPDYARL